MRWATRNGWLERSATDEVQSAAACSKLLPLLFAARIHLAAAERGSRERAARAEHARQKLESCYDWELIAGDLLATIEDL